jgi:hypothetical protein
MTSVWHFRLQGATIDLLDLADSFPTSPLARVSRDGEQYYLEVPIVASVTDD